MAGSLSKPLHKLRRLFKKEKSELDTFLHEATGVIHIGANTGQERRIYARNGLDVVWIEPIPDVFSELESNIANLKRQRAFRYILTDRDGDDIELNIASNNGAASSIFEIGDLADIWPEIHYTNIIKMKSTTFQTFMRTENIDPGAYNSLVMDTQGSELLVLKGAGDMLQHFRFIKAEAADFEAYVGCCQVKDLSAYLSEFGFSEIKRKSFAVHSNGGQYFDVVYER